MRLIVDIDGVLSDTVEAGLYFFNSQFNTKYLRYDIREYNPLLKVNSKGETVPFGEYLVDRLKYNTFHRYLRPMPGASQVLHELVIDGYEIVLATARAEDTRSLTIAWLANNNIPYHDLQFRKDKENMAGDLLIEDHRDTLVKWNGWEDNTAYPLRIGLLFDASYNQGNLPWPLRRIGDWFDVRSYMRGDLDGVHFSE